MRIDLPGGEHTLREPVAWERPAGPPRGRVVYAAAHVVADPLGDNTPGAPAAVDWDATLRFRRHLWSYGLRVADAMDTAQRNMGLDWPATRELIRRSAAAAAELGDPAELVACGAGTDHAPGAATLEEVTAAYTEQAETVREAGAGVILMASRQLAAIARGPEDYHAVYGKLLSQADRPVILHWLGEMFDPNLAGYWGSRDVAEATASFLELIREHAAVVEGVKVSLLDAGHEVALRAALPEGVRLYTGDDFNYPSLIASGSHALLGIFDAIAPAAAAALAALDAGDTARYDEIMGPTVPLSRKIFETPTYHYKTGIVFLAWLNGHQDAFTMVNGAQASRSLPHLAEVFRLADRAGLLADPEMAVHRMRSLLAVHGC
ncbi:dihydrodipicolinate synthase family protein [Streptosporangium sandarakinum]|uniref:Dihydrodipicolinate synthase/N-acetylneuraminate lyase n=1 Tax=Streptosporangium sandarakinum TaxID=1260955 RepID=A0A852V157_9ACTN|nr:dihydrodipicolinate synthase family protein [Streptosporangium sandarakinum]NYF43502.1 dihydrodipicolinate synthase/N-acetylneuraminate lyase [Streptosporangium sandarakinum]